MTQRKFWLLATPAAVVATLLAVTFRQTPKTPQSPKTTQSLTAAEKFRQAMASDRYRESAEGREQAERFRKWQEAQRSNKADLAFDEPAEAMTFFLAKRVREGEVNLSPSDYLSALNQADSMATYSTALQRFVPSEPGSGQVQLSGLTTPSSPSSTLPGAWEALGPGNIGGRTRALLIHPTTPDVMWAAGVAGGIWKSTDAGASWVPKADLLINIAVNSMLLDPRNPDILYAGTGEGFFNQDGVRGAGILKSTDGGNTWAQLPSTATPDFYAVQKIVMSKGSSQRLYAATNTGIWRSNDAGASWARMYDGTAVNGCMDLAIQTDRALAYVIASCGTFAQASVRRAIDTAATPQTWTQTLAAAGQGRTSLAIAPSNQNIVYALAASNQAGTFLDGLLGVWRSADSGRTWTQRVSNTSPVTLNRLLLSNPVYGVLAQCGFGSTAFFNQGWYDNVIAVDPANPDIVWAGGIDLFRSDDAGANWGQASQWWFTRGVDPEYAHADNHTLVFHPGYDGSSNKIMYNGSDGGIYRTDDARAPVSYSPDPITSASPVCGNTQPGVMSWTGLNNGYETTQFYHGVPYPDGATFFGGTQDNGTIRGSLAGGRNNWAEIFGGDGGYVAVNPNNTNMLWEETTGLSIRRSTNGGTSWSLVTTGINEAAGNFLFITPFAQDPSSASRMWIGGAFPWRAANAAAVPATSPYWARAGAFFGSRIGAWAVAPQDSNRVYAGTGTGGGVANDCRVFTTDIGTTAVPTTVWSSSKVRPDRCFVSWIAADPGVLGTVYVTVSTFNSGANVGHVFKSTNFGTTWTNIDGSGATGIPDVPAHTILVDPDNTQRLYLGTDIGVFVSLDGGANWARENTGFANVITEALALNQTGAQKYIYAFTHGRSLFRVLKP